MINSYLIALLVCGVMLVLLGLVGKIKLKDIVEVGSDNLGVRSILAVIGILLMGLSFWTSGIFKNLNNSEKEISNPWAGIWEHTSYNWDETVIGKMQLWVDEHGIVTGKYTYYRGSLEGTLSKEGWSITGQYKNRFGIGGDFHFKLNPDSQSFNGSYATGQFKQDSENFFWHGKRVPKGYPTHDLSRFEAVYNISNKWR